MTQKPHYATRSEILKALESGDWVFRDMDGRVYRDWSLAKLYYETEDNLYTFGTWEEAK